MRNNMTEALGQVHATLDDFQLLDMKFPDSLTQALEETQQKKSELQTLQSLIAQEEIQQAARVTQAQEEA